MIIIAITGLKRSGKDTLAELLKQLAHTSCSILHFADPLKECCQFLFDLTHAQLHGDDKELVDIRWGVSSRQILQFFGTELMQHKLSELMPSIGRTLWVRKLVRKIKDIEINDPSTLCIVSDMRFMHEYNGLKEAFPKKIIVLRVVSDRCAGLDAHPSEKEWLDIPVDYIVENNGTLQDLKSMAIAICDDINKGVKT
jgi:hypothetical protein